MLSDKLATATRPRMIRSDAGQRPAAETNPERTATGGELPPVPSPDQRLAELVAAARRLIDDDELRGEFKISRGLARRFAELLAERPDVVLGALLLRIATRPDAGAFVDLLNRQLARIPPVDGQFWQFISVPRA